jgi:hypothetical protein
VAQGQEDPGGQDEAGEDELLPARQPWPPQMRKVEGADAPPWTLA